MVIELFYIMVVVLAGIGGMYTSAFGLAINEGRGLVAALSGVAASLCYGGALTLLDNPPSWVII